MDQALSHPSLEQGSCPLPEPLWIGPERPAGLLSDCPEGAQRGQSWCLNQSLLTLSQASPAFLFLQTQLSPPGPGCFGLVSSVSGAPSYSPGFFGRDKFGVGEGLPDMTLMTYPEVHTNLGEPQLMSPTAPLL